MQHRLGHLKIRDTNSFKEYERSLRSFSRLKSCMRRGRIGSRKVKSSEWAHTANIAYFVKPVSLFNQE